MGTIGHREPCFYYAGKRDLGNCNQDKSSFQEKRFFSFFLKHGANFHKACTMLTKGLSVTKIDPLNFASSRLPSSLPVDWEVGHGCRDHTRWLLRGPTSGFRAGQGPDFAGSITL